MLYLSLVGLNHRTAPLELLEKTSLRIEELQDLFKRGKTVSGLESLVVLSTCNRTELYALSSEKNFSKDAILSLLAEMHPAIKEVPESCWYLKQEEEVISHLFRVSAGMDSLMVGEPQILGQVKAVYQLYCDHGRSHPVFHKLFHLAFRCGKRIRTETGLGEGIVSVASAAVDLALKIFGSLEDKDALLVGAGETGEQVARHLIDKKINRLLIANRTGLRAEDVAARLGGKVIPFEKLEESIADVDMVLFCTDAPEPILTNETLKSVLDQRLDRPLFLIDLGVPRNCDSSCGKWGNVFLFDLENLKDLAESNLAKRKGDLPKAEAIVQEMLGEYREWIQSLQVEPIIHALLYQAESIRSQEIERMKKSFQEEEWDDLNLLTNKIIKKIFHRAIVRLKQQDGLKAGLSRIEIFKDLFGIDEESIEEKLEDRDEG